MQFRRSYFSIIFAMCFCLPDLAQAQYAYDIVNLGSLGAGGTLPEAINNEGQITGYSFTRFGVQHAFYYSNGQMHDVTPQSAAYTIGVGINDHGQIAIDGYYNPLVYDSNTQAIRTIPENGNIVVPQGINNNGDVVLNSGGSVYEYHYSTSVFETLHLNDVAAMYAINNNGELAGEISQVAGYYKNGVSKQIGAIPGNFLSTAYGLNDNGDICGVSDYQQGPAGHAFLYRNGVVQDLGTLQPNTSSLAQGVNNSDVVTGQSGNQPFVYQNGQMQDLFSLIDPSLGWTDGIATAINNEGWIVGNGNLGAFVAIPRASAVPEPGCLLTFGVGIGAALLAAHFRRRNALPRS